MNNTGGISYEQKKLPTETSSGMEKTGKGMVDNIGDAINKMHIKKLFFVVMILGYCVIAFSKGAVGVSVNDLWNYVIFIVFSLAIYICLNFFEERFGNKESIKK